MCLGHGHRAALEPVLGPGRRRAACRVTLGRLLRVTSLVRRLTPFLGILEGSTQADVGVPVATGWVCGTPRLIAADLLARPALAGRGWAVFRHN